MTKTYAILNEFGPDDLFVLCILIGITYVNFGEEERLGMAWGGDFQVFRYFFLLLAQISFSGWFLARAGSALWWGFRSRSWASAQAEIVWSDVKARSGRGNFYPWEPVITYRFNVDGKEFDGNRLKFGRVKQTDSKAAHAMLDYYVLGSKHVVFYDPDHPQVNVLQRDVHPIFVIVFLVGVFGVAITMAFIGQVMRIA